MDRVPAISGGHVFDCFGDGELEALDARAEAADAPRDDDAFGAPLRHHDPGRHRVRRMAEHERVNPPGQPARMAYGPGRTRTVLWESRASRPDVRETRLAQQAACDKVASLAPVVQQEQRADLGEEPAIALLTRQNTGRISAAFAGFPTLIPHWRPGILRPSRHAP